MTLKSKKLESHALLEFSATAIAEKLVSVTLLL